MTSKRKQSRELREEKQANKVVRMIFIGCAIVAILFIVIFSFMQ